MSVLKKGLYCLLWLLVVTCAFVIVINISIVRYGSQFILDDASLSGQIIQDPQTIIVLGASVYRGGSLSNALQGRVDKAVELFNLGVVPTILISGDNRTDDYNELRAMRNNLVEQGVDTSVIFQDFAGFDTYDSMHRARSIFQIESALIATQEFHLYRAIYIARKLGIDARGVPARSYDPSYVDKVLIREYLARIKARLEITFGSSPKFLGDPVPIDGESNGRVG